MCLTFSLAKNQTLKSITDYFNDLNTNKTNMFQIISYKTLCLNFLRVRFSFKLIQNVLSRLTCTEYYQFNYNWMLRVYVTFKKTNFHSLFQFKITRSLNLLVEKRKYASLNLICLSANKTTISIMLIQL